MLACCERPASITAQHEFGPWSHREWPAWGAVEGHAWRPHGPVLRLVVTLAYPPHTLLEARFDPVAARPWCGLRPMSADGVPIIGPTPISNLLVSTGHGHLGWTLAAGSAQLLADLMCETSPAIDPTPFALRRFR